MSDIEFTSFDRPGNSSGSAKPAQPVERKLVMRPESFFSHRFHLEVQESNEPDSVGPSESGRKRGLKWLVDLDLALLILVVGVPVLLYSVFSSIN